MVCSMAAAQGQTDQREKPANKHFVSTSLFMLANFLPDPPHFFQLNYGRRLTEKDALMVEAITWQYPAPLGIPYGESYGNAEENFPGIVRDFGIGLAYQRFWWKKLYTTFHATPFLQQYLTPEREKIQTGFQLFLTARVGYRITFLENRCFLEPSVAFTHWPINTNLPAAFAEREDRWPNYFLFEPGLHVGYQF